MTTVEQLKAHPLPAWLAAVPYAQREHVRSKPPVWMHVTTGWKWTEHQPKPGTKVARQGKVRLEGPGRRVIYIRKEELCAPYWIRTTAT